MDPVDPIKELEQQLAQHREEFAYYLKLRAQHGGKAFTSFEVAQKIDRLRLVIYQETQQLQMEDQARRSAAG